MRRIFYVFAPQAKSPSMIWVQSHHNYSLPSLCPPNSRLTNMLQRKDVGVLCVLPIKEHEQKGRTVTINEDTVDAVDGNGHGDAKVAQKRPVERRKSESANIVPRTKRMKASGRKKKGERVGETTKMTGFDEPTREKMFVTT